MPEVSDPVAWNSDGLEYFAAGNPAESDRSTGTAIIALTTRASAERRAVNSTNAATDCLHLSDLKNRQRT